MGSEVKRMRRRGELSRQDWIEAARDILINGGKASLSLRGLSEALGVTTGAFYSLFTNLDELHDAILEEWIKQNSEPLTRAIEAAGSDGMEQYLAYVRELVLGTHFDPRFDNAIRDWAHSSQKTAAVLRDVEARRVEELRRVFLAMGFTGKAALIRARVTYFHQVGYNAMQIKETLEERLTNIPYYAEILTERTGLLDCVEAEDVRDVLLGKLSLQNMKG
ncbi:MAG: TetR/AcrR family transcriptional regulator [Rhodobacteraceae bacterium]|nr:MAG: TetR/AcrR family transcriptional regulator [Paracoccaceae bacterium]